MLTVPFAVISIDAPPTLTKLRTGEIEKAHLN